MGARKWLAGLAAVALLTSQTSAEVARPIGQVMEARRALLESAEALRGATVFSPQKLATLRDGALTVRVEQAQLTLASDSAARLEMQDGRLRATVNKGAARMSWADAQRFELSVQGVVIRAASHTPVYAEVSITGPNVLRVTSHSGTLSATLAGITQIIPEGKTYQATVTPQQPAGSGRRRGLAPIWWVAIGAGVGVGLWLLLRDGKQSVSPSVP